MNRIDFELQLENLEERLKNDRDRTYQYKMSKRNWLQRFFNIKPDMSFCDMCIMQDRLFTIKNMSNKYDESKTKN